MIDYIYPGDVISEETASSSTSQSVPIGEEPEMEPEPDLFELIVACSALEQHYKGAAYLKELAQNLDNKIDCSNLYHINTSPAKATYIDNDEIENGFYSISNSYGCFNWNPQIEMPIEAADDEAIKQVAKYRLRLIEARVIAESENNIAAVDDIIDKLEKVDDWICKAVNRFGKPRYFANKSTKDYQNVDKALVKIVEKLREIDPALGRMCDNHLVRGTKPYWSSTPIKKRKK